jgi:hypothetical protein
LMFLMGKERLRETSHWRTSRRRACKATMESAGALCCRSSSSSSSSFCSPLRSIDRSDRSDRRLCANRRRRAKKDETGPLFSAIYKNGPRGLDARIRGLKILESSFLASA